MASEYQDLDLFFDFEGLSGVGGDDSLGWVGDGDLRLDVEDIVDPFNYLINIPLPDVLGDCGVSFNSDNQSLQDILDDCGGSFNQISQSLTDLYGERSGVVESAELLGGPDSNDDAKSRLCPPEQPTKQADPPSQQHSSRIIGHGQEQLHTQINTRVVTAPVPSRDRVRKSRANTTTSLKPKNTNDGAFIVFSAFDKPIRVPYRRRLNPNRRKEVHEVRKIGSCVRCQLLKKPVSRGSWIAAQGQIANYMLDQCGIGEPCPRCRALDHRLVDQPCIRENLAARAVYRRCEFDSL